MRRRLSLWQKWRDLRIDTSRETFRTDYPFAGIPWFERPDERSTFPRTSHLDRAQRDPKSSRRLAHCGEAAFVGICAATQYDRLACLAMKHRVGIGAAYQKQHHEEHKTFYHTPSPPLVGVTPIRNVPLSTRWIGVAAQERPHFSRADLTGLGLHSAFE
jgi:hypothetical protein